MAINDTGGTLAPLTLSLPGWGVILCQAHGLSIKRYAVRAIQEFANARDVNRAKVHGQVPIEDLLKLERRINGALLTPEYRYPEFIDECRDTHAVLAEIEYIRRHYVR